ncbi:MAG: formate dehydrogenase subunit delta [Planctomycetes bacterium]|nr:formate dehydrogenase subunit delta [Planctomycetota bacterium]
MNADKLVMMANQIASYFQSDPDRAEAIAGTAGHIKKFWEPRMRRELLARFDERGGEGMHELVVAVLTERRAELEPVASA